MTTKTPAIEPITTNAYQISRQANGIINWKILADTHIDAQDIVEGEQLSLKLINKREKKILLLIDANNFHTLSPEAIGYLQKNQVKKRVATALVSNKLSQKIVAGFLAKAAGSPSIKTFSTEAEAVKWLLSFKHKA
ncbi:MAG: STAS/SEC14 domain-containing protein [Bacteroidia bacterium]